MKGKLIVFEGIDGAGKATQVERLEKRLLAQKVQVTVFKSPRYDTPTGQLVKDALHGAYGDFIGLSPYLSAVPYLLDFAASRDEVLSALKKGTVICDRYVPSTLAYHAAKLSGESAKDFIARIEDIAYGQLKLPKPELVIYLDTPVEIARRLMEHKQKDQHERDAAYQGRVAHTYAELAKASEWHTVQCMHGPHMRSVEDIGEEIAKMAA